MAQQNNRPLDPLPVFCFKVSFTSGVNGEAFFKSVSGLKSETEVVDYKEGGLNFSTRRLVGGVKWPNIVLKRGFTGDTALIDWRQAWMKPRTVGQPLKRAVGSIDQLDHSFNIVYTWKFVDAWPCKWEGPELDASKSELAIETLELAHEGLVFEGPGRK